MSKEPTATIVTGDTSFAAALVAHGGHLLTWSRNERGIEWTVENVTADAIEDYKSGRDGFRTFNRARRMLCDIAHTTK